MVMNKEVQALENSSVKLTVTIDKAAAKKEYDQLIQKYSKTVQIKGFRKGKVPAKILEQKFGDGLKEEAQMKVIEESLKVIFDEIDEKPLPYCVPELQEDGDQALDFDKDFTFSVVYDVFPEITLGSYKDLTIEAPDVQVLKKHVDKELKAIQEQNAMVVEKKDGKVAKDDIVTINYSEVDDEGNPVEGTLREDFVFTVGSGYNFYKLDDDIIGMVKDEEKVVDKQYPEDFEIKEYAGQEVKVKVKVTAVKVKELPALDDELAQDVSDEYETLKDLKDALKKQLKEQAEAKLKQDNFKLLFEQISENSTVAVPKSMVEAELENSWRNFVQQSRLGEEQVLKILEMQGKNKSDLREEWRANTEKNVKIQLLLGKIVDTEKIEASDDEVDEEIKKEVEGTEHNFEDMKESLKNNHLLEHIRADIVNRKAVDFLLAENTVKKGEKVDFLDFMGNNQ